MRRPVPKPTAAELEILHVLWNRGPLTVRGVLEALNEKKSLGYTGVLKLLQIMTSKGMVRRDESERAHIYEPIRAAEQTKRQFAKDVLHRVFEGSASQLMMHALADHRTSANEIIELRRILNAYEEDDDGKAV